MLPTEESARHRVVASRFTELVSGTTDWAAPAPVAGWTAGDVVDHLHWITGLLDAVGVDLPPGETTPDGSGSPGGETSDRLAAWQDQTARLQALLEDPAGRERIIRDERFPEMTLTQMIDRLYSTDVFLHTWDLARATGQDARLDADHCAELYQGMLPMDEVLRASGQYGPRVAVPEDASAQDRLLGFVGRDPAWGT